MAVYSKAVAERVMRILQASGQISSAQIDAIMASMGGATGALGKFLDDGLDEQLVLTILSRTYELPHYLLNPDMVVHDAVRLLPANFVLEEQILPFAIDGRVLQIAIMDPSRAALGNQVKALSNYNAAFFLVAPSIYYACIEHPSIRVLLAEPTTANDQSTAQKLQPTRQAFGRRRIQYDVHDAGQVIQFVDDIFQLAVASDCSDIHIEPYRVSARIRMRIDGVLHVMDAYSDYLLQNYLAVITRFKLLAACDISEKRLPQDGAISFEDKRGQVIDTRLNIVPAKHGERCVIRLLRNDAASKLENLGLSADEFKKLAEAISAPQGMVLVTGPTGSGKTTTLYSALQWLNDSHKNIMTAEDPIEYYLEGLGQVQANERIGLNFSAILRAFLRQDPEIILVGEIRDYETVEMAIKAALTGHLLLSTLHTNDAITTINRLKNMGVADFMIATALSLIVAQRLARLNCPHCLVTDMSADTNMLTYVGFTSAEAETINLKKGQGCAACNDSGYNGRQGIYEVLPITPDIESAILAQAQAPLILEAARAEGFITLAEKGRDLMRSGVLCFAEYNRILLSC